MYGTASEVSDYVKKIAILAAILIVPSVFFLLLKTGKNHYNRLEIFGPKDPVTHSVNGKEVTDTVYHTVADFNLIGPDSVRISDAVIRDKIYVADFFFTSCKTICPEMSIQMARIQHQFKNDPDVVLLSHTVDPENDTPEVLKQYAVKMRAIPGKWYFLTGEKKDIYDLARHSYFITAMEGDGTVDDFIHSEQFVLVDKQRRIRGFYDGTDAFDIKRLMDEIKVLKVEYEQQPE